MVPGIAHLLILIGSWSGFVQQVVTSHLALVGTVVHQDAEPRPYGEQMGKRPYIRTVDDVSSLLDRSGCCMLMSGSVSKG